MKALKNFVGGKSIEAKSGKSSQLINPATGQAYMTAPVSDAADVDHALKVAEKAFGGWRDSTPSERQRALLKIADALNLALKRSLQLSQRTRENLLQLLVLKKYLQ